MENNKPLAETVIAPPLQTKKGNKNLSIIIVVVIILLAAGVGVVMMTRQPKKTTPNEAVVVNKEPSPTEAPRVDKASVKIQVVNGTGTPGQPSSAVNALTDAGFTADNITTGNADEFSSTTTTITVKSGFEGVVNDIKDALGAKFSDISVDPSHLDDTSDFDVKIVTGGKKFEEPTSTPAPTTEETPTDTPTITPTNTPIPTPTP